MYELWAPPHEPKPFCSIRWHVGVVYKIVWHRQLLQLNSTTTYSIFGGQIKLWYVGGRMVCFGFWVGFTQCTLHSLHTTGSRQYVHNHCDVFCLGNPLSHHPFHSDPKHHSRTHNHTMHKSVRYVANQRQAKTRRTLKTAYLWQRLAPWGLARRFPGSSETTVLAWKVARCIRAMTSHSELYIRARWIWSNSMNLVQRDKIAENQNWSPEFLCKIEF